MINRRGFVAAGGAAALFAGHGLGAGVPDPVGKRDPRLVLVILRGGMDGLGAIAPYGDRHYQAARGAIAMPAPGKDGGVLALDDMFGAHPALGFFHREFAAGRALALHAVASPYRDRSHFDAQNVLELGLTRSYESEQGWLNRAVTKLPQSGDYAIAIGQSVPLVLRGREQVASWAPSAIPEPSTDALSRVMAMFDTDEVLGPRLAKAYETDALAGKGTRRRGGNFNLLIDAAVRFLTHPNGPRIAVVESSGWDTHANQGRERGQLAGQLRNLDEGITALRTGLGDVWQDTVVMCVTEFGRTVRENGTRGTDHGTASAVLAYGGALKGGRVIADWPGLAAADLFDRRDLAPTMDLRAVYRAVLEQHLGLPGPDLDAVLPGTSGLEVPSLVAKLVS